MTAYDQRFYERQRDGSYTSARIVLELLRENLAFTSACDVGCGAGTWVRALLEQGVAEVTGYDGDYARPMLMIPPEHFVTADLRQPLAAPRRYDLAISLEVAEHLPPARSESFVADLVALAPAVLFSAAVPFQGGTDHMNERWQGAWAELFARHGYRAIDLLRPRIWDDRRVEVWYRQNTLLYLAPDHPQAAALHAAAAALPPLLSMVHPDLVPMAGDSFGTLLRMAYWLAARRIRRTLAS